MSMLSKSVAIIAAPVGLMLSAASAHEPTTFTLSRLGGLGASFSALMALAALVVIVANIGLLRWQEWRDGRKRGPN